MVGVLSSFACLQSVVYMLQGLRMPDTPFPARFWSLYTSVCHVCCVAGMLLEQKPEMILPRIYTKSILLKSKKKMYL